MGHTILPNSVPEELQIIKMRPFFPNQPQLILDHVQLNVNLKEKEIV